jgi:hypothetical protein
MAIQFQRPSSFAALILAWRSQAQDPGFSQIATAVRLASVLYLRGTQDDG